MSAGTIILIVVILVVVAVAAAVVSMRMRRRAAERSLVGPEYDRLADEVGPRKAKAEFEKRRQRVDGLGIRSLSAERRTAYAGQWDAAQEQFVDSPAQAVSAAAALVTAVAVDRGYEVTDHDQLMTDLSVYHGRHLDGYRNARQTTEPGRRGHDRGAAAGAARLPGPVLRPARVAGRRRRRAAANQRRPAAEVPAQRPWKQVTQGRHWKTRPARKSSDVAATRQ